MRGSAVLADLDAGLLEAVPAAERPAASRLRVPTLAVTRGAWRPPASSSGALLGLLVADGIAFRCVTAAGFATGDLVGRGDVVPARTPPPELPGGGEAQVAWHVVDPLTVAVLNWRFAAQTARWPALTWRLFDRHTEHTERLMARLSLVHRQRVEERLVLVLWDLAERWGKVTPQGVLVPIPLRHHQLAALVASLRPSVTLALQRLAARGIAERCVRGYLLHDSVDDALARLERGGAAASG
jgi:CRP/FNR family cyclic AMP-dependent transcriptional regulator